MINSGSYILGFSDSVHDRSVCLFLGGEPIVAIEEERLSRVKHGLRLYEETRRDPTLFSQMSLESVPAEQNEANLNPAVKLFDVNYLVRFGDNYHGRLSA